MTQETENRKLSSLHKLAKPTKLVLLILSSISLMNNEILTIFSIVGLQDMIHLHRHWKSNYAIRCSLTGGYKIMNIVSKCFLYPLV